MEEMFTTEQVQSVIDLVNATGLKPGLQAGILCEALLFNMQKAGFSRENAAQFLATATMIYPRWDGTIAGDDYANFEPLQEAALASMPTNGRVN